MPRALYPAVIRNRCQEPRQPRQRATLPAGRDIAQAGGQDMDGSDGTTSSRHGRLARQRGLPGQADVDSHLTEQSPVPISSTTLQGRPIVLFPMRSREPDPVM